MKAKVRAQNLDEKFNMLERNDAALIKELREENERMKAELTKLKLAGRAKLPSDSVIEIIFKNKVIAQKYQASVERFLKELLQDAERFCVRCETIEEQTNEEDTSFCIDRFSCPTENGSTAIPDIPFYHSSYDEALQCNEPIEKSVKEEKQVEISQLISCFNCLGSHHLKDCPEKIDRMKISENRQRFQVTANTSCRYHDDESRRSEHLPGQISEELREALNLKSNQLPLFIYRMRILGYPPGWMREAEIENSGLYLYDSDGLAVKDGHCSQTANSTNIPKEYDGKKFIAFQGFNTPTPENMVDEWKRLNMPPLLPHQQLSEALKHTQVKIPSAYKKRRSKCTNDSDFKKIRNGTSLNESNCSSNRTFQDSSGSDHNNVNSRKESEISSSQKKSESRKSLSLSVSQGTHIIDTGNPCKILPDCDKFAEGITEHLPFENLPDSVGTFEKMRVVLSELRKKMNTTDN